MSSATKASTEDGDGADRAFASHVSSEHLRRVKRRFVWGINLVSGAGVVAAVAIASTRGVHWLDVALLVTMYTLTGLGITTGYHRYFAHKAFDARPSVRAALAICGAMAGHGPVITWVATHRCHHKYSDKVGDPHSPHAGAESTGRLAGLWHAHLGWLGNESLPSSFAFAPDLLKDKVISWVNRRYVLWVGIGIFVPALVGGLVRWSLWGALTGLLWGGLARMFFNFHATCSINSITHTFGSRPTETADRSTNFAPLVLPTLGEAWHNHHHSYPGSARFGVRWWQIDPGYMAIRILEQLSLVWNVRTMKVRTETNRPRRGHGAQR